MTYTQILDTLLFRQFYSVQYRVSISTRLTNSTPYNLTSLHPLRLLNLFMKHELPWEHTVLWDTARVQRHRKYGTRKLNWSNKYH